jgi:hypothetical protein
MKTYGKRRWVLSFTLRPLYPNVCWIGHCMSSRAGLNAVKSFYYYWEPNPDSSAI